MPFPARLPTPCLPSADRLCFLLCGPPALAPPCCGGPLVWRPLTCSASHLQCYCGAILPWRLLALWRPLTLAPSYSCGLLRKVILACGASYPGALLPVVGFSRSDLWQPPTCSNPCTVCLLPVALSWHPLHSSVPSENTAAVQVGRYSPVPTRQPTTSSTVSHCHSADISPDFLSNGKNNLK